MNTNNIKIIPPNIFIRVYSVWYRHVTVYTKNIFSNGAPPFVEPLIFLAGIGLGLGKYIADVDQTNYVQYLGIGLPLSTAMFTASLECSFGTFVRLEFSKIYEGMLTGPLSVENVFVGEVIWGASKGLFFSFAVMIVLLICGIIPLSSTVWFIPLIGFLIGIMFASLSLFYTSFVKDMNHLNFYASGLLTPMFMFSGIMFPISNLPKWGQVIVEIFPLIHTVNIGRALCAQSFPTRLLWDFIYCFVFFLVIGYLAIKRLRNRIMS